MSDIVILDIGIGNVKSILNRLKLLNYNVITSKNSKEIMNSRVLILPGVGNFGYFMDQIDFFNLRNVIKSFAKEKEKKVIGICLGMHILFSKSSESKSKNGLGLIEGEVIKFHNCANNIGYLNINPLNKNFLKLNKKSRYYFCHSFYVKLSDDYIIANSYMRGEKFPSIIKKKNIYGIQFHPEISNYEGNQIFNSILLNENNSTIIN